MPDQLTKDPVAQAVLVCRLRHRQSSRGYSPTAGEIEIENRSADAIEIENDRHPLQYLDIVVADGNGVVVNTQWHYGDIFSPRGNVCTLRLGPGEKYTHVVSLMGTIPAEERVPGTYTVHAVYEYNGLKAVSEPLRVELPAKAS
jgi:hypothetical protein